jgi:O-antigen/teichoic acid export membrane protein
VLAQFKRLGKHSLVYGLSNAMAASVSLLLLPLLTRYMTPAEYGALDLAIVLASQVGSVLQLGLGSAVFKFILQDDSGEHTRERVLSTAYCAIGLFGLAVTAALVAFAGRIAQIVLGDSEQAFTIVCVLLKGLFEAVAVVPLARLRVLEQSVQYGRSPSAESP